MNWLLIALINPLAHSISNHFDKYLLSKHIKGGTVGALIVFTSLFAFVALPVIAILRTDVLSSVSIYQGIILIFNGALVSVAVALYLYALNLDEASYVAPFFQFVPVFGFTLGYLLLGEGLSKYQLVAALLIVFGSLLLSIEFTKAQPKFKTKVIALMAGSSFFYALNAVVFKFIAVEQGFLDSLFWDMLGKFLFGVVIFVFVRKYRQQFLDLIRLSGAKITILNILSQVIELIGELSIILAVLLAPIALVQSVGVMQPLFVLLIGVFLTLYFPRYVKEEMSHKHLAQKFIGIFIVMMGVLILTLF